MILILYYIVINILSYLKQDFLGGAAVKIPCFHCRGHRFDPWLEN